MTNTKLAKHIEEHVCECNCGVQEDTPEDAADNSPEQDRS